VVTLTQLAGADMPVQFAIEAEDDEGNTIDPTVYPVAVTFAPVTSPPTVFNPATAIWYTNTVSWSVQAGNPEPVYWVNAVPGPDGIPVAAGSCVAYAKITVSPGFRVLPCAYMNFL
jgi:hypothetical protein